MIHIREKGLAWWRLLRCSALLPLGSPGLVELAGSLQQPINQPIEPRVRDELYCTDTAAAGAAGK